MADPQIPSWPVLVSLMVHGPDVEPTVHGLIRSADGTDESRGHIGFTRYQEDPDPVFAGAGTRDTEAVDSNLLRVWRDGTLIRIEEADGSPNLIVGDDTTWSFDRGHPEPLESSGDARYGLRGTGLMWRREAQGFLGNDFTRPTGPIGSTTFLGRLAWTVELAPPASKPHPLQLVVDAETGLLLQRRNDGFGTVDEWVELVVGEPLEASLFRWDGPTRKEADEKAARMAEHEADMAARREWVAANVLREPLRLQWDIDIELHWWDDETGAFDASLGRGSFGSLARRLTSAEAWDSGWGEVQHRWTAGRWDWLLTLHDAKISEAGLAAVRAQLAEAAGETWERGRR